MLVHVRLVREGEIWAAQCLEYDIAAQGNDEQEALARFRLTMQGQIALNKRDGKEPLVDIPCAPIPYWCGIERELFCGVRIDPDEVHVI